MIVYGKKIYNTYWLPFSTHLKLASENICWLKPVSGLSLLMFLGIDSD